MPHTILGLPQVKFRVGLSRSSIYQAIYQGEFPRPGSFGSTAVGWVESGSKPGCPSESSLVANPYEHRASSIAREAPAEAPQQEFLHAGIRQIMNHYCT